jgi:tRNA G46 methylase TrmB
VINRLAVGNSRRITTNQKDLHEKLPELVTRYLHHHSQKPFSQHTVDAFEQAANWLNNWRGELILDACCGVAESTLWLAERFPNAKVLGVDKSQSRLDRYARDRQPANMLLLRADLNDFWRLARQANWQLSQHYLLYPNPYPKSAHIKKRWYASPALANIVALGGKLEVRSNWQLYVDEFAWALELAGFAPVVRAYHGEQPITPFERKYWNSGQQSWQLECDLVSYDNIR